LIDVPNSALFKSEQCLVEQLSIKRWNSARMYKITHASGEKIMAYFSCVEYLLHDIRSGLS
jgi:hypothetical protein